MQPIRNNDSKRVKDSSFTRTRTGTRLPYTAFLANKTGSIFKRESSSMISTHG